MLTIEQVNQQINSLFASNDVIVGDPGEEAFWNAVEEVQLSNPTAAKELEKLSNLWLMLQGASQC